MGIRKVTLAFWFHHSNFVDFFLSSFLQHRFNPPAPYRDDSLKEESDTSSILSSIAESTTSDSREAMLEIQS